MKCPFLEAQNHMGKRQDIIKICACNIFHCYCNGLSRIEDGTEYIYCDHAIEILLVRLVVLPLFCRKHPSSMLRS